MKSVILAFSVCLFLLAGPAMAQDAPAVKAAPVEPVSTLEEDIIKTMMVICMPPVIKNMDIAAMAETLELPEMPPENAARFDPSGGRVFGVRSYPDNIIVLAGKNGACTVAARGFNSVRLWEEVDKMFGPGTPFLPLEEKSIPGGRQKDFKANYDGPTVLFVIVRDSPQDGMLQGVLTYARVED